MKNLFLSIGFLILTICKGQSSFENGSKLGWGFGCGVSVLGINTPQLNYSGGPMISYLDTIVTSTSTIGTQCTNGIDNYGGFSIVSPDGGTSSLLLNNNLAGGKTQIGSYYMPVTPGNSSFTCRFAAVLQRGGHSDSTKPYFAIQIRGYSMTGMFITELYDTSSLLPNWQKSTLDTTIEFLNWTESTIDLSAYLGYTVGINYCLNDCSDGQHFGYAYIDGGINTYHINSSAAICNMGDSTILTGPPGMLSYNWNGFITGNTQSITTTIPGTYTLSTTSFFDYPQYTTPLTYHVMMDTVIAAFGTYWYCNSDSIEFTDSTIGNPVNWQWDFGDGSPISYAPNPKHLYLIPGIYNATLIVSNTCGFSDTTSRTVTINPAPSVSFSLVKDTTQNNLWIAYVNYSPEISDAIWDWGDGNSSYGLYGGHAYATPGNYNICVTAFTICGDSITFCISDSLYRSAQNTIVSVNVFPTITGITSHNKKESKLLIYPNPADNDLKIESDEELGLISIFNCLGELCLSKQCHAKIETLPIKDLPKGAYTIFANRQYLKLIKL